MLGGIHKATNNVPPGLVPAKGKYMLLHDIPRFVKRYDVPFKMNSHFPINTLGIMRGCYAAKELGCFDTYVNTMFEAIWVKGLNMGDQAVIASELEQAGIDVGKFTALVSSDDIKNKLKEVTGEAVARGCFGAPTMFIGDQMYFGQDRLDFIEEEVAQ